MLRLCGVWGTCGGFRLGSWLVVSSRLAYRVLGWGLCWGSLGECSYGGDAAFGYGDAVCVVGCVDEGGDGDGVWGFCD